MYLPYPCSMTTFFFAVGVDSLLRMPERQGGHDFSRAVKTKAFRASVPEETGCPTSRAFRDVGERHPHSAFAK
jgi:hypothetical protein